MIRASKYAPARRMALAIGPVGALVVAAGVAAAQPLVLAQAPSIPPVIQLPPPPPQPPASVSGPEAAKPNTGAMPLPRPVAPPKRLDPP